MDHLLRNNEGNYPSTKPWWGSKHLRQKQSIIERPAVFFSSYRTDSESSEQSKNQNGKGLSGFALDLRDYGAGGAGIFLLPITSISATSTIMMITRIIVTMP